MFVKTFICFYITIKVVAGQAGDSCLHKNISGVCSLINDCEVALRSIHTNGFHRLSRCGFDKNLEIVCCPLAKKLEDNHNIEDNEDNVKENAGVRRLRVADKECKNIVNRYNPPVDTHIIGGEIASAGEFPHTVALGYRESNKYFFRCGGSLISERHVLTAAHCVNPIDHIPPSIVRLGVVNISGSHWNADTDYGVEKIYLHPNSTRPRKYHDLAIIKLVKTVQTSDVVYPVCLYTKEKDPTVMLDISGWGKSDVTRAATSEVLLKARLTIVPRDICNQSYTVSRRLPEGIIDEQLCAQDTTGNTDTCQGDSGGPLQGLTQTDGHPRLVGITSFGNGCGTPVPGVYTRVYKYLDWIEAIVWPSN
ncbi:unnamed protein product, partial [Iphiclides podalirius]